MEPLLSLYDIFEIITTPMMQIVASISMQLGCLKGPHCLD